MSTSLLYHAWGLRGYDLQATDFVVGGTVFRLRQNPDTLCCGNCGSLVITRQGVKDIQKRHLLRHYAKPRLKNLRQIAIDEISIGRGHRYLTVVLDLKSGAVVFVGAGKGTAALEPFWKRLRCSGAKVRAVATDMSPAYILAVAENLPKAVHVFDRFHVMKLFNEQLADLRMEVQQSVEKVEHRKLLKGTLWLLLKNPENLDPKKHERQRLQDALRINQPLATAYCMREDLRQFWQQADRPTAHKFLDDWIARAQASGVAMLQKFARTLQIHLINDN